MEYLIDSHTFLWHSFKDSALPVSLRKIIENPDNKIYLSIASIWEIGIKINIGKLDFGRDLDALVDNAIDRGLKILTVRPEHVYKMMTLPLHRLTMLLTEDSKSLQFAPNTFTK